MRFWEHLIRDEDDLRGHLDYLHYNPVKHGHVTCPHLWEASSYARLARERVYPADWGCQCRAPTRPPAFDWTNTLE